MPNRLLIVRTLLPISANTGWALISILLMSVFAGCNPSTSEPAGKSGMLKPMDRDLDGRAERLRQTSYKPQLADYGLFQGSMQELRPAEGVFEYELNTPLFSDYSQKQRVVKLPPGTSIKYKSQGPLDFPIGTVIAKTFYYAANLNQPDSKRQLIETRILEHRQSGWVGIPYLWNEAQTEAKLAIAGATVEVEWRHTDGKLKTNSHQVPNLNDCKRCHTNVVNEPIGPKAHNLNRDVASANGERNQLAAWSEMGILNGLPELDQVPRLSVWNNPSTGTLDHRARAYLEVNCAHCHSPIGPARNSGLHLNIEETKPYHLGTYKTPVAAGKGTGGRLYGIVPGKPDESIMEYRMRTIKPGEIMPEFGKSMVHREGLALIRDWITQMESPTSAAE